MFYLTVSCHKRVLLGDDDSRAVKHRFHDESWVSSEEQEDEDETNESEQNHGFSKKMKLFPKRVKKMGF